MKPNLEVEQLEELVRSFVRDVGAGNHVQKGWPSSAYRISKVAMNCLTRILAKEHESKLRINAICPGWVRTGMGGPGASRSVEEGAETIVWAALLPPDGPTGGFFRDKEPIPW